MNEQSNVLSLAEPKGEILVFGGAYSNLQALEAMMEMANELQIPASNIICTGDVVGYCANPEEVVQKVRNWGIHVIAGNVELQLRDGEEDCGCDFSEGGTCDLYSKQWYPFAQSKISKASIDWMKGLPEFIRFSYAGKKVAVVHGSYEHTSEFIFKSTDWEVKAKNLELMNADVVLAGHCGLPFSNIRNNKHWLNAGVIGMPANDATTRVWFMTLSSENGFDFKHQKLNYQHAMAAEQMRKAKLPEAYAKTLETGLWDNCEILPDQETREQGQLLQF